MKYNIKTKNRMMTLQANSFSLNDVLLLVAEYYGEEWYGCTVQDENGNFICIPVKEYFTEGDPNKSVYQWAIEYMNGANRMRGGLVHKYHDSKEDEEVCNYGYNPFVTVSE